MKVLVTGGTGYIGSHVVIELLNQGHEVHIVDNLINSKITVLDSIEKITNKKPLFTKIDLLDKKVLEDFFRNNSFDLVIHFAALKSVAESTKNPLLYYENNITGTLNLLGCMKQSNISSFIFSSSATVYGDIKDGKCVETLPTGQGIASPYGKTKYMIEEIMKDLSTAWPEFSCIALRYFNPIGNHPSGLIGEDPNGTPNNLMPYVMKVAKGELPILSVYGGDYPTPDGTCLRDYIHVVDLAKGHIVAINALNPGFKAFNLGTGRPSSVLEIVSTFNKVSGRELPYKIVSRRPGDLPILFADPSLAKKELGWHTELTVEDAMKDTIKFLSTN